ncbi:hypothetical protein AN958_02574 [Leucoagaricus sp. SymC.cos]|nr:hypothetical protein AN958_02574 [Leucoagaricus sp. SymC.cos]
MARFYLFDSAHKLLLFSRLLARGSKRLVRSPSAASEIPLSTVQRKHTVGRYDVLGIATGDNNSSSKTQHSYDPDFYLRDSEGGSLVFLAENTLFKVHRCLLLREPSAFVDMVKLPSSYPEEGRTDGAPIVLLDSAEKFKDLLWALYAPPSIFLDSQTQPQIPLRRLLNIVEMTNKYCFESYSSWSIRSLRNLVGDASGPLRNASSEVFAHVLHVAALCDHRPLLDLLTRRLISRLLWTNMRSDVILEVAERHRLAKIIGVIFYKELIGMEHISPSILVFPDGVDAEKRMQLLAAQQSLAKLWDRLRLTPPTFHHDACLNPEKCRVTWVQLWRGATRASSMMRHASADVLGRLKSVVIILRKTSVTTSMSVPCTLAALESISRARDDIVDGLIDHFVDL